MTLNEAKFVNFISDIRENYVLYILSGPNSW